ncbi:MAG: dihydroorotate dehydrogenase [Clostridia bacterium]
MNKTADLRVDLCGITLKNPVIAASGTYGFGREYSLLTDLNKVGGIAVKGLTLQPRQGNKSPRIVETPSGILNSVGLQNPGVDAFIREELPFLRGYDTKIIVNIAGNTMEEYVEMAVRLEDADIDFIELNISCPNVRQGCASFGATREGTYGITKAVRMATDKPLIVKLTPNVTDIGEISRAAEEGGADCISLINTMTGMVIDTSTCRPVLANNTGGLSGPAVRPVALRMTYEAVQSVGIPVIGMGGITCGDDALQFIIAGAHAIMIGTWNFMDPDALARTVREMETHLLHHGLKSIGALRNTIILNG